MDQRAEEEAIFKMITDFQLTWNNGDAKGVSEFFTDDCLRVDTFGDVQNGKKEVESAYIKLFKDSLPGSKIVHEQGIIRFLGSEFATWQAPLVMFSPRGKDVKGHTLVILRKTGDRWLAFEMHAKFFPV